MSEFITTARVNCGLAFETARRHVRRLRHEAGQTAAEYMGVLLVISVIIAAVATTDIGTTITTKMGDLVGKIASGENGVTGEKAAAPNKEEGKGKGDGKGKGGG